MIIENTEGLSSSILKSFIRHNNIVKAYIEFNKAININNNPNYKEKLILYIKSQITINAGYDEKQRIESLIEYVQKNISYLLM